MKKIIFSSLFAVLIIFSIYKVYHKSGSFNDLVLRKYTGTQFTSLDIHRKNSHKVYMDTNTIKKFLAYLKKAQLTEYKGEIPYKGDDIYLIGIYSDSDNFLDIAIKDKNYIEIDMETDEGKIISRKYKIKNNSLNLKYIEDFYNEKT